MIVSSEAPAATPSEPTNLAELLRARALSRPDDLAYSFLADDELEPASLTYGELDARARAIAALLQSRGLVGERALLFYPPGLEYIAAFWGCMYAGVIAVPLYPPRPNRSLTRLETIASDARARIALTTTPILTRSPNLYSQASCLKSLGWLASDNVEAQPATQWQEPEVAQDSPAYIQYTSGSTSAPKGVIITHRNVLSNSAYIDYGFEHTSESISLTWLPHFHDMGLVDGIIQPVYKGFRGLLMSPVSFLKRPFRWLQFISKYRVTHSGGPNFAYDLCVRKVSREERELLDLSSWVVAYNGAEPIRNDVLESFASTFSQCGFRLSAFYPAYGLAEATLKVSGGRKSEGPIYLTVQSTALEQNKVIKAGESDEGGRTLVGSGRAALDTKIVIADTESFTARREGEVGEIWVRGPGVASGYFHRPDETEKTFRAHLSDTGEGPFLRTGDLGFLSDGELFVTGRLKDLIIIRGRNHYPQDIEQTVEQSHPSVLPNSCAAFPIDVGGEERLVVVQEVERHAQDCGEIIEAIRRAVAETHEVELYAVSLLRAGTISKTSSGKIQRNESRKRFLDRSLSAVAEWQLTVEPLGDISEPDPAPAFESAEQIESWLASLIAKRSGVDPRSVRVDEPVAQYGLDSLASIELAHSIELSLCVTLPVSTFLQSYSISDIASQALKALAAGAHDGKAEFSASSGIITEYPLSRGQQAIWFLHKMAPQSAAYNIASAVRIKTGLDIAALERAFHSLVIRHLCLRTTFTADKGEPRQRINSGAEFYFHHEDCSSWSDAQVNRRLSEEAHRPFDLQQGPLLRVSLFTRSASETILLLVIHHIVADFWSLALLINEMCALYEAEKNGRAIELPALDFQYADFVQWQNDFLASDEGERLWSYWRERLAGELPALNLLTDRTRPAVQTYRGASLFFTLSEQVTGGLKTLSLKHSATLYMTLMAAFQSLLYRYTGQEDILVGSPTVGRRWAGLSRLVGYFVNPVVVRAEFSESLSFESLLDETRRTILGALEHQDYPFALLVKRLKPERDLARSPIFQTMFVLQKAYLADAEGLAPFALGEAGAQIKMGEMELESVAVEQRIAQFDLTLAMAEAGECLSASLEYNTDLFDETTIARMAEHFQIMLEAILSDPSLPVSDLPMMSDAERAQVLFEWNTAGKTLQFEYVHRMFEERAMRAPDAISLVLADDELTYRELNERANRLANYLQKTGIGPESRVVICLERSVEMIVALLGVLKAGGAYIPLDTTLPSRRIDFVVEDAQATIVLTQSNLAEKMPAHKTRVICLDAEWEAISRESAETPPDRLTPANMAYVIYTSGSTGTPKGVMVEHQSFSNYVTAVGIIYGVSAEDRILQFFPISFDGSIEDIYIGLTHGATLVLRTDSMVASTSEFISQCRDQRLSILDLPTAYWQELAANVSAQEWASLEDLRLLVMGGERALPDRVELWRNRTGERVHFMNSYGPTETTVGATLCDLSEEFKRGAELKEIPIGRPIANAQTYVLNERLQPLPIGIPGALYIGGPGVARGYLNRADLTAENFIPDPFADRAGARLYKTGDRTRLLPCGNLEFLGRIDGQVKVRGFRVELGEIESALRAFDGIQDAVVTAREYSPGIRRLVAYSVVEQGRWPEAAQVRSFLRQRLPEYAVPASFVFLDSFPLMASGKMDRNALPEPDQARPELTDEFAAPRNLVEEQLAKIWAAVLKLESVGIHDNFFELGGDSILSLQVIARARQAGLELSSRGVFERPTVAQLAATARPVQIASADQDKVVGELPLTPIQSWFFEQEFAESHHWNMALHIEMREKIAPALIGQAFTRLSEHHDALRLRFIREGLRWKQTIASENEAEQFQVVDLSTVPASDCETAIHDIEAKAQASLDLSSGPLMRVVHLVMGEAVSDRLLIIIHHLAIDAVSWRILLEDLDFAVRNLRLGKAIELPRKTTSIKSWAERLAEHAVSDKLRTELDYWLAERRNLSEVIPVDYPEGVNLESSAGSVSVLLTPAESRALLGDVARSYRARVDEILMAALVASFAHWTGRLSLLVELEGHGREEVINDADLSRTVGWFTGAYPVELALEEGFTPTGALHSIKEQLRRVPHKGLGYGLLRYMSRDAEIAEKLRAATKPEVAFNYLGQFEQTFDSFTVLDAVRRSSGLTRGARNRQTHLLEINGGLIGGQLQFDWIYSKNVHRPETIERVAGDFLQWLRMLIASSKTIEAATYTPSDFPLAKLDRRQLDQLTRTHDKIEDIYPLSPAQQGMLFHSLYTPKDGLYIGQLSLRLRGELDSAAFEKAWRRAAHRHAALRTSFAWENLREPLQIVNTHVSLHFEHADWRGQPVSEQEARLESFLESDWRRGFDLSTAPLLRFALIRFDEDRYEFVWTHHHILLDGWCVPLLLKEVFNFYEAEREGRQLTATYARPYRDYIEWLDKQDGVRAEMFWRDKLKGFTAPTPLPVARTDKDVDGVGLRLIELSEESTAALKAFARRNQITLNTVMQGAWALLLCRYSGQSDVVFGVTVSGRPANLEGVDSMIGLLINTLPMRVKVQPDQSLSDWMKGLQAGMTELRQYEFSPLVEVQGWSEVPRGKTLFDSILAFENYPLDRLDMNRHLSLDIDGVRSFERTNYALTIVVLPGAKLEINVSYERRSFDDSTIEEMLESLREMLEAVLAGSDVPLSQLLMIGKEGREPVFGEQNERQDAKPDLQAAVAPVANESKAEDVFVAPRDAVEEVIAAIWTEVLGVERVGVEDSFFALGGHSLLAARVLSTIRYLFKVDVPLNTVFESPTVASLAREVVAKEARPGQAQKIAGILKKIGSMSTEDVGGALQEKREERANR